MKTKKVNSGVEFQDDLIDLFGELQANGPFFFHRFPDSKTARVIMAPQPSDFLCAAPGGAWLVEAKSSTTHLSFSRCWGSEISPMQAKSHVLWHRSGNPSYFFFISYVSNVVEVWSGHSVLQHLRKAPPESTGLICEADGTDRYSMLTLCKEVFFL